MNDHELPRMVMNILFMIIRGYLRPFVFIKWGGYFDSLDFMSYLCGYDNDRHITDICGGYHPDGGGSR